MLTMIGAVASFERELLLERQAEGIAIAKAKGKYKGRKPISNSIISQVIEMNQKGKTNLFISKQVDVSISSIYRILARSKFDLFSSR